MGKKMQDPNVQLVKQTFVVGEMTMLFSCKATGKSYIGPRERHRNEDAAVLHVVRETRAKGMPVTRQAVQVKATQTDRSLTITNCKAVRG
jgi:hypothetical protein